MRDNGMRQGRAVMPVADWRRATEDRPVNRVPVHMRDKIAATAERVATAFEISAQVLERMAAQGGARAQHHRSRAAWHQALAQFERRQANALRAGRLLPTPQRPGGQAAAERP